MEKKPRRTKQPASKKTKIIQIAITLLVCALLVATVIRFSGFVMGTVDFGTLMPGTQQRDPMKSYSSALTSGSGDNYYVRFKDVIGTAQASSNDSTMYYNMDLTVQTPSLNVAKNIQEDPAGAVDTIRGVMSQFRREDVVSEEGREYLKNRIRHALAVKYGSGSVDEIYLEKFLFQAM